MQKISFRSMSSKLLMLSLAFLMPINSWGFDRSTWSSPIHKIRFSYDNKKWIEDAPTQDSTIAVINWLSKKSKGLISSCYLATYESGFGKIKYNLIHEQTEDVGVSIKNTEIKRSMHYQQTGLENRFVDNYPVIYLSRIIKYKTFDGAVELSIYSIITAWNGREIMFSCSSSIPTKYPQYKEETELHMFNVLKTLQFDR